MSVEADIDRFLYERKGRWYYNRRTPKIYHSIEPRQFIRSSLKTKSLRMARERRDHLEAADNALWETLSLEAAVTGGVTEATREVEYKRHEAAIKRAMAQGFSYQPAESLIANASIKEILERLKLLEGRAGKSDVAPEVLADAVLGTTPDPEDQGRTVSEAFKLYVEKIAFNEQKNKSPKQRYSWEKTKRTSITYFIEQMGDLVMENISRKDALGYRDWWMGLMLESKENPKPKKANTANRHIGNMRTLYDSYFQHIGQEEKRNPFRNMFFKDDNKSSVEPFSNKWVRERILAPGMFDSLHVQLRVIIYILIETGARMSEICNLMPEDINLTDDVPHIYIKPRPDRELKTPDSERKIPLVGCALVAMHTCPMGFDKYRDRGELVSNNLMKAFRKRNLLESPNHVVYSLRHSFEKRMLEANVDYALRCTLMGHKNDRPAYGDGGSMFFRQEQLLKIAHPFSSELFDRM